MKLLELGCNFYEGVEGSSNMFKAAQELLNTQLSHLIILHKTLPSMGLCQIKY